MAKIKNSFKFVGKLGFKDDGLRVIESQNNKKWHGKEIELKVSTDTGTGTQYVKLFGGVTDGQPIFSFSKDKDEKGKLIKLEIPFSKRNDADVIKTVADFKKIKILDKEFISEVDAIDYLEENKLDLDGKRLKVMGDVVIEEYKGKVYTKYYVNRIFEAKDEDKDGFTGDLAVFFNKDAIDEAYKKGKEVNYTLVGKDRKLPLDVYVEVYNKDKTTRKEKPYFYLPIQVCFALQDKFDFENENHKKRFAFNVSNFLIKSGIKELGWTVRFFKGAEKTEITMADLTNFEKAQIENGVKTFEEIAKFKEGWGQFKEEIQLIAPHGSYEDGAIDSVLTDDDLEVVFFEPEEKEEVKEEVKEVIVNDEDLF